MPRCIPKTLPQVTHTPSGLLISMIQRNVETIREGSWAFVRTRISSCQPKTRPECLAAWTAESRAKPAERALPAASGTCVSLTEQLYCSLCSVTDRQVPRTTAISPGNCLLLSCQSLALQDWVRPQTELQATESQWQRLTSHDTGRPRLLCRVTASRRGSMLRFLRNAQSAGNTLRALQAAVVPIASGPRRNIG